MNAAPVAIVITDHQLTIRASTDRVPRRAAVRIEFQDRQGERRLLELHGFPARVVQHEYDHLDGVLTLDRAESTQDIIKASEIDAVEGRSTEEHEKDTE